MYNNPERARISAVIPIRNGETYIRNCLNQVQKNLSTTDEAIFVVNGSSDSSIELLSTLSSGDERVRILEIGDVGLVEALNIGVHESSNNWIARFDVDDDYDAQRIELQKELITETTAVIFSDYRIIGEQGQSLGYIPSAVSNLATMVSLFGKNRTAHPSAMFSKEVFKSAGMYKKEDFAAEDLGLWLRMTRLGEFKTVPKPLLNYNLHGNSVTLQNRSLAVLNSDNLLRTVGIPSEYLKVAIERAEEIASTYNQINHSGERTLLFLHNLIQMLRITNNADISRGRMQKLLLRKIAQPGCALAALNLAREYESRRKYRRQHSESKS